MKARKLNPREKLMRSKYTRHVSWCRGSHTVYLKVDHQGFSIAGELFSRTKADWLRDMLAIALARIGEDAMKPLKGLCPRP
jgi:hypothetical protein